MNRGSYVVDELMSNRMVFKKHLERNEQVDIRVEGMLFITSDVTPELAKATIRSLIVWDVLHISGEVKEALVDKIL